jgi:crotonobetainyl-CoA:carnitine CoA-transferase CaiB-like acyl-CoA transferase
MPRDEESLYRRRDDEPGPLAGVRVLDLTIARAGPTCTRQLADLGADVIHVGNPKRGDLGGSDHHNLARDKRSVLIDLKQAAGQEIFSRLLSRTDVLVENFRADVKHRLGIEYESLRERFPRLIYASISGFGQQGPYRERPGLDPIAQGMAGLMSVTGPPGGGPWRAGIAVSDTASGTFLCQGVLAALFARERSGRGQWVHTSLLESMVNFMDFQATRWLIDGVVPESAGNDHPTIFPMGTFKTRDHYIVIAAMMNWQAFVEAIGGDEIATDPRFADHASRLRNREALAAAVNALLERRTTREWIEILSEADLPCGPVNAMDEVFADPQMKHLEMTRRVNHARDGDVELIRHPVTFSETPTAIREAAALAGADTREVLAECGYDDDAVSALIDSGAVAVARSAPRWGTSP